MIDEQIEAAIQKLFDERPIASEFVKYFSDYCSLIDDQVDEDKSVNRTQEIATAASRMFNCAYWKQYGPNLVLIERVISIIYFDSVKWEKSTEQWKRQFAKVNSHCAAYMLYAVILIEYGEEKLKEVSLSFMEQAYNRHKEDVV